MRLTVLAFGALIAAATAAVPASAQQAAQPTANQPPIEVNGVKKKVPDPNEVVCEKERDSSSRLISNEVCMTRGQWAEQRRLTRMEIDKAQIDRPMQH